MSRQKSNAKKKKKFDQPKCSLLQIHAIKFSSDFIHERQSAVFMPSGYTHNRTFNTLAKVGVLLYGGEINLFYDWMIYVLMSCNLARSII